MRSARPCSESLSYIHEQEILERRAKAERIVVEDIAITI